MRILEFRTLAALGAHFINNVINMLKQKEHFDLTERYLNNDGPKNIDLARQYFPYAKIALQAMIVSRMLVFFLSIRWRKFTRLCMFIDVTIYWLESFLPIEMPMVEYYTTFKQISLILSFILGYFYWTPTLIYCLLASALWHLNHSLLYEESLDHTMAIFVSVTLWFSINIFVIHLVITWVGKLFAKAQVLKSGNDNILDNLEEGVVILDGSDKSEILYYNLAATGCKRN